MADLDTRSQRASSVQLLAPYVLAPPEPDAGFDSGDLQHGAWSFSGIIAAAPDVLRPAFTFFARARQTTFSARARQIIFHAVERD